MFRRNPTPPDGYESNTIWTSIESPSKFSYLDISDELTLVEELPYEERVEFWDEVYHEYDKRSNHNYIY